MKELISMYLRTLFVIFGVFLLPISIGCHEYNDEKQASSSALDKIDINESKYFKEIITAVDNAIGKHIQSMEFGPMQSASYAYAGSIDKVVDVIDPLAKQLGFRSVSNSDMEEAMKKGQESMDVLGGMEVKSVSSKWYQHENGNLLSIARMDITSETESLKTNMQMLTINVMNPGKMSEFGEKIQSEYE